MHFWKALQLQEGKIYLDVRLQLFLSSETVCENTVVLYNFNQCQITTAEPSWVKVNLITYFSDNTVSKMSLPLVHHSKYYFMNRKITIWFCVTLLSSKMHSSYSNLLLKMDFWWLNGKESACQCRRCRFNLWVGKIPWRRTCQPTPVSLPGESHGQRSLTGYIVHEVTKARHNLVTKHPPPILKGEIYSLEQKS